MPGSSLFDDLPSSETVYGLPESHWHCHLRNFEWDGVRNAAAKRDALRRFVDRHEAGECPHLLMLGKQGAGKTHLAIGLYRWGIAVSDLAHATFLHVPTVSTMTKARFDDPDAPDPGWDRLETSRLVVLDDPFGRKPTDWELDQIIPRLIDSVYRRRASLVVTANHNPEGLKAFLHPHEISRLLENAIVMDFSTDRDRRVTG